MSLLEASTRAEPAPALPNLIVGLLVIFVGLIVVRHRKSLYESILRRQRNYFGQGWSDFARRLQTPFWIGVVGACGVAMGVVVISYAVWRFVT